MNSTIVPNTGWNATQLSFDNGQLVMNLTELPKVVTGSGLIVTVRHFKIDLTAIVTAPGIMVEYSNIEVTCYIGGDSNLSEERWDFKVVVNDKEDVPSDDASGMPGKSINNSRFTITGKVSASADSSQSVSQTIFVHFGNENSAALAKNGVIYFFFSVSFDKKVTCSNKGAAGGSTPARLQVITADIGE